jgi:MFS family permease
MMAPLAFAVLATETTGSYRLGGLMMSVFVVAELISAGPAGRLLDRVGVARGMRVLLVLTAGALLGMVFFSPMFVVPAGVFGGGLSGGFRALLTGVVGEDAVDRAVAVDSMILEVVVVGGPLVVALLTPFGGVAPVAGMAASYLIAALFVPTASATPRSSGHRGRLGITSWLVSMFAFGHLLSTIEVASLPLAQRLGGGAGIAVVVVAVLTGASLLGAALYAWLGPRMTLDRRLRATLFLSCMATGGVLVAFGGSWPVLLAGLVTVGICTGPLNASVSVHLQRMLPADRRAEGFALMFTAQAAGFALGSLSVSVLPLETVSLLGAGSAFGAALLVGVHARATVATAVTVE